ncbi:hypothetical protein [Dyadobacter pollutisoli]|uniref:Uncharacterized protein n=1 Tax=Dyadobacter pollutisoli TaxID=2910158 RepID=A0A9E8SSE9_9BACT|nr:hypothetical protein [Dyadobacter pollutisoli]WAC15272.1 hypothetical protein ON006_15155 [Dyadobacter pollutisoli]
MNKVYTLTSALTCNSSGQKYDAIAARATEKELKQSADLFDFDFLGLCKDYIVYKLFIDYKPDVIQGLVGFRPTPGILECANMETSHFNKRGKPLYNGAGKALVALCCKISLDHSMDGYIYFDAKNKLIPYYERMGAKSMFGIRMAIESASAEKLVECYFKNA